MEITIRIECDNAAFGENSKDVLREVKRILGEFFKNPITRELGACGKINGMNLRDVNGNTVGEVKVK